MSSKVCTLTHPAACPNLASCPQVFVEKLKWLTSTVFLELLALCQCMPGPTSTQVSFALGVTQKGTTGGLLTGACCAPST